MCFFLYSQIPTAPLLMKRIQSFLLLFKASHWGQSHITYSWYGLSHLKNSSSSPLLPHTKMRMKLCRLVTSHGSCEPGEVVIRKTGCYSICYFFESSHLFHWPFPLAWFWAFQVPQTQWLFHDNYLHYILMPPHRYFMRNYLNAFRYTCLC